MEWCIWQVQGLLHQYSLFGGSIVNIGDTNAGKIREFSFPAHPGYRSDNC